MSDTNTPWLEYRLDALNLDGGVRVAFPHTSRLLYNPADKIIAVETTDQKRLSLIRRGLVGRELRRIEYAMLVEFDGRHHVLRFFHPMKPGNGVVLMANDRQQLFFANREGRPLFSKQWTLRDVSRGKIKSDFAVWQFHGWRHEH